MGTHAERYISVFHLTLLRIVFSPFYLLQSQVRLFKFSTLFINPL